MSDRPSPPTALTLAEAGARGLIGRLRVVIDGADVTGLCVGYDQFAGWVDVHVMSKTGRPVLGRTTNGLLVGRVSGAVEVNWDD